LKFINLKHRFININFLCLYTISLSCLFVEEFKVGKCYEKESFH
jgi:hypothetical protein